MSTITPQSLTLLDSSGKTPTGNSEKLIPAGGTLQATVRQVAQDQLSPNVFRLKLEANSVLMELKVPQPIPQGSQVTLSRSATGQLSVTVNAQDTSKTNTANGSEKPLNVRTYQTTATPVISSANDSHRLNRLIPTGQTITAQVTAQTSSQQMLTAPTSGLPQTATQPQITPLQTPLAQTVSGQTAPPGQTTAIQTPTQASVPPLPLPTASHTTTPLSQATTPLMQTTTASRQETPSVPRTPRPAQAASTTVQASLTTQSPSSNQQQVSATAPNQTPLANQSPLTTQTQFNPASTKYSPGSTANLITINIKGENVSLKTSANLPPLQQVLISRSTTDQLLIRWSQPISSSPAPATTPLTSAQAQTIEASMRELLPQQITLSSGIQQLLNNTQSSAASTAVQIDKVVQSLMLLFGVQPGAKEARDAIKQNISYGGLFTENKLANNQPPVKDMKQFLGKMQALAEQLPDSQKQIIQTTIGKMLARITTNQLHSLQHRQERSETNERFFQLDLPVQSQNSLENVELRISQRSQKNSRNEPETIWKVRLHFDLEEAGSVDAELNLNQEKNELSASFTCANNETATSVRNQLDSFKTQLTALGLKVPALACKQGVQRPQQSPIQKQLIDIKT